MSPRGTWQRLARYLRPALRGERGTLGVAAIALAVEVGLRVVEPWPLKVLFDHVLQGGGGRTTEPPAWLPPWSPGLLAASVGGALLLIVGLRALAGYVQTVRLALAANRILTTLRGDLFRRLQVLPLSFHGSARAGDLTVRLTNDVGMLQDVTLTAALPLVADACILVGMLGLMCWLQPMLTLVAIVPVPFFIIRWRGTQRRMRDVARQQRRREGAMAATAAESMAAIRTVQALSLEDTIGASFTRANQKAAAHGVVAKRLSAGLERSVDLLIALSTGLLLWFGTRLVLQGAMTAGELLVFAAYLKTAFKPLQSFAKYTGRLSKATAAAERVLEIMERAPETADPPGAVAAPPLRGEVRMSSIQFGYGEGPLVLRDLHLSIRPGELVAVVGPSGAGKSTIAHLLLRLYRPQGGMITVDGHDVSTLTLASLRAQVGVVLQDTILFAGTIRDNLALGNRDLTDEALWDALAVANARDFVRELPEGLDTRVGERGVTMSSGQRQRLAIARAALRPTPLLLLDEPTVGLDEENDRAVSDALLRLARGRTTLLITHALHLAARADRVFFLHQGHVVEAGAPSELLRNGGAFAQWYRDQAARMPAQPVPLPVPHAG